MPGNARRRAWPKRSRASEDGLTYEFVIRRKGPSSTTASRSPPRTSSSRSGAIAAPPTTCCQGRVAGSRPPDPRHVRFKLKKPWPDFLTFYEAPRGAGWIVPKKYVEKVGDEGFKKHPIGAGPYKFVSFTPGVELVLEAFDGTGARPRASSASCSRSIPEESTRLAALKRGEVDIAYSIRGELAEEVLHTPG